MQDPTKVVGRRVVAFIIDGIILSLVSSAIFFAMADTEEDHLKSLASGDIEIDETLYGNFEISGDEYSIAGSDFWIYVGIVLLIGILYRWVLPGLKGWTPGKLMLGIRVVGENGQFAGIWRNAVREILWIIDGLFVYLVGFITAMTTKRHQRVGDLVAKTFVIQADAVGSPVVAAAPAAAVPPPAAPPPPGGAPPAPPPPPPPG